MSGRYVVQHRTFIRNEWWVQDLATNPPRDTAGPYTHQADADAEARRLNTPPPPRPRQAALFNPQEV